MGPPSVSSNEETWESEESGDDERMENTDDEEPHITIMEGSQSSKQSQEGSGYDADEVDNLLRQWTTVLG